MGSGFVQRLAERFGDRVRDDHGRTAQGAAPAEPLLAGSLTLADAIAIAEPVADIEPDAEPVRHRHSIAIRLDSSPYHDEPAWFEHEHVVDSTDEWRVHAHAVRAYPITSRDIREPVG